MKKTYSISLEEDLMKKFTELSIELGTNRTNFLSMIITNVVKTKEVKFVGCSIDDEFETVKNKDIVNMFNNVNGTKSSSITFG